MGYDQEADKTHQEVNEDVISDLFDESVLLTFSIEWAGLASFVLRCCKNRKQNLLLMRTIYVKQFI